MDLLSIASLIGVGVSAAVREAQIANQEPDDFDGIVRQGAFATAGVRLISDGQTQCFKIFFCNRVFLFKIF